MIQGSNVVVLQKDIDPNAPFVWNPLRYANKTCVARRD